MQLKNIEYLIDGNGEVTLGRCGPVSCAATASDYMIRAWQCWHADLIAAGLSPLAPERELIAASRIFLSEIERRFPRSLNNLFDLFSHAVDHCICFMNDGNEPVLLFEQHGENRKIVHEVLYQQLLKEANA